MSVPSTAGTRASSYQVLALAAMDPTATPPSVRAEAAALPTLRGGIHANDGDAAAGVLRRALTAHSALERAVAAQALAMLTRGGDAEANASLARAAVSPARTVRDIGRTGLAQVADLTGTPRPVAVPAVPAVRTDLPRATGP